MESTVGRADDYEVNVPDKEEADDKHVSGPRKINAVEKIAIE